MSIIVALGVFAAIITVLSYHSFWEKLGLLLTPFGYCLVGTVGLYSLIPTKTISTRMRFMAQFHSLDFIVNPSLFTSVTDMLEDTMQATLPRLLHGVCVA